MSDKKTLSKEKLLVTIRMVILVSPFLMGLILFLLIRFFGSESILRSDIPLSREEYLDRRETTLPKSAHNIFYLVYGAGLQDLERYFRFDIAPNEGESCVETMIGENNTMLKRQLRYERLALKHAPDAAPRKEFLPMPWWNPQEIQEGYYRGENKSHAVNIWVDTKESRIYVYTGD